MVCYKIYIVSIGKPKMVLFSSPGQRPCELLPSLGIRRSLVSVRRTSWTFTFKSSPLKLLNRIKPNLAGIVLGWVPFKIVSDSPALHSRWLLLLKMWNFSFNRFIPIIQIRHILIKDNSKFGWDGPWVVPFQYCVRQLHPKWLLLLKIEISVVVNFCFITNQNELKF